MANPNLKKATAKVLISRTITVAFSFIMLVAVGKYGLSVES